MKNTNITEDDLNNWLQLALDLKAIYGSDWGNIYDSKVKIFLALENNKIRIEQKNSNVNHLKPVDFKHLDFIVLGEAKYDNIFKNLFNAVANYLKNQGK